MHSTYEQHSLGRLLPPIGQDDFQRLAAGIAARDLDEEIVLYQGRILDGLESLSRLPGSARRAALPRVCRR